MKFYTVYKLQRMPVATTRLYLLCFAYYRFRQINDNLIEAFIHLVDQYEKSARTAGQEAMQLALRCGNSTTCVARYISSNSSAMSVCDRVSRRP